MTDAEKKLFTRAWYLAYADQAQGVDRPNFNQLFNKDIERISPTIPQKYWDKAKGMSDNEAFQLYNNFVTSQALKIANAQIFIAANPII